MTQESRFIGSSNHITKYTVQHVGTLNAFLNEILGVLPKPDDRGVSVHHHHHHFYWCYSLIRELASSITVISYKLSPMSTQTAAVWKIRPTESLCHPRIT
jgi:hypothetical protein